MRVKHKEDGTVFEVDESHGVGKGVRLSSSNSGEIVGLQELMRGYELVEEPDANWGIIATSNLANVEIAGKDYTEGDKKYFTFDEALKVQEKIKDTGWRLPTRKEWSLICEEFACGDDGNLNGQLLIDKLGLGLNGWQDDEDQQVRGVGGGGDYWSSVAGSATNARYLHFNAADVYPSYSDYRALGFSVRCVRDIKS